MRVKPITLLTLTAFLTAVSPSYTAEPAATGLISKGDRMTAQEKADYKLLAAHSAPDLRRAGMGADSTGHYVVLGVFTAIAITAVTLAATKKSPTNPTPAPPPPPPRNA